MDHRTEDETARDTERRLRDADPLARRTPDAARDQEWLRDRATAAGASTPRRASRRRSALAVVAAAAAVVLTATAGSLLLRGGDEPAPPTAAAPTVTDLTMPADDAMASCIMFSVDELARAPMALGGEVVEVADDEVLLDVERWYRGGDTDQVRLTNPDANLALLGYALDFEVGERYLLTAYEGNVSVCGFSGPWDAALEAAFDQAFG